ncbi:MAG: hypothetical protein Q9225_000015 [Loekoesia sp. 1 TL-2023]
MDRLASILISFFYWTLHMAAAAESPGIDHPSLASMKPPSDQTVDVGRVVHVPNDLYSSAKRSLGRTFRCDVQGTQTVLVITVEEKPVWRYRMFQLLVQTQKLIRRRLKEHGDRPLLSTEIPFIWIEWGLRIKAEPPSDEEGSLTWGLLDNAMEGLFVCAYNDGVYNELSALIFEREDQTQGYRGSLELSRIYHVKDIS